MAVDVYSKTAWNNGTAPSLSETQLNHIETGIKNNNMGIIALQSVQAECENYASESEASKIASANSATSASNSALSALASANTAKAEADRAVAVVGIDIATDLVAGLVRGGGNIEVDANGDMNVPIANNLTTTESGYVLDARQGKALSDSLTNISITKDVTNANGTSYSSVAGRGYTVQIYLYLTTSQTLNANTEYTIAQCNGFKPVAPFLKYILLSNGKQAVISYKEDGSITLRPFETIASGVSVLDEVTIVKAII